MTTRREETPSLPGRCAADGGSGRQWPRATAPPGDARERPTAPCRELPCLTQLLAVWVMAAPAFIADVLVEQHHLK
ncbi:hypothetical protein [Streptomyces sp. SID1034]|uniref:hypothetical protein n=1 Tax=Streptomyces TaxID=1883 RepID=UPI00136F573C|nr:hypothetical protein [Streptomyces sp. SID1034]MYV94122.1 hypothetical protein [Streptomyces sp. SID1034]